MKLEIMTDRPTNQKTDMRGHRDQAEYLQLRTCNYILTSTCIHSLSAISCSKKRRLRKYFETLQCVCITRGRACMEVGTPCTYIWLGYSCEPNFTTELAKKRLYWVKFDRIPPSLTPTFPSSSSQCLFLSTSPSAFSLLIS